MALNCWAAQVEQRPPHAAPPRALPRFPTTPRTIGRSNGAEGCLVCAASLLCRGARGRDRLQKPVRFAAPRSGSKQRLLEHVASRLGRQPTEDDVVITSSPLANSDSIRCTMVEVPALLPGRKFPGGCAADAGCGEELAAEISLFYLESVSQEAQSLALPPGDEERLGQADEECLCQIILDRFFNFRALVGSEVDDMKEAVLHKLPHVSLACAMAARRNLMRRADIKRHWALRDPALVQRIRSTWQTALRDGTPAMPTISEFLCQSPLKVLKHILRRGLDGRTEVSEKDLQAEDPSDRGLVNWVNSVMCSLAELPEDGTDWQEQVLRALPSSSKAILERAGLEMNTHFLRELLWCCQNDLVALEEVQVARATQFEDLVGLYIREAAGIKFLTENEIRTEAKSQGLKVSGATPDLLFTEPVVLCPLRPNQCTQGEVLWLECKNWWGSTINLIDVKKTIQQARKYAKRFGPGAVLFSKGFSETMEKQFQQLRDVGVQILDGSGFNPPAEETSPKTQDSRKHLSVGPRASFWVPPMKAPVRD